MDVNPVVDRSTFNPYGIMVLCMTYPCYSHNNLEFNARLKICSQQFDKTLDILFSFDIEATTKPDITVFVSYHSFYDYRPNAYPSSLDTAPVVGSIWALVAAKYRSFAKRDFHEPRERIATYYVAPQTAKNDQSTDTVRAIPNNLSCRSNLPQALTESQ